MADSTFVDVFDAGDKLLVDSYSGLLVKSLLLNDVVKKFTIDAVLHNQVKLGLRLDYLFNSSKVVSK